ncbi:MAG: transcriptional regulator [Cyanobium sp. RS427]|jgi:transcriptional regulator with XRE-family HTH domain|nr:transcriptional regulator [Cyanobium sp. RS427]|tara:strand:+ start:641 stop:1561 length:921 start_codon:yes stop_codon:yes gene_type:complete
MRLTFLRPWWRRSRSTSVDVSDDLSRDATLRELGQMLKQRRETEGLSLRELAQETRITTPVIEALERGWSDRLPERAYLASMLPQLERRLALTPGVLQPVLPPAVIRQRQGNLNQRRFTLGSIDVFTTWQGSVVYAALIALSLLTINRQQQNLALRNSQSLEPVRADLAALDQTAALPSGDPQLDTLRPLDRARTRRPQDWLNAVGGLPVSGPGVLTFQLSQPRQLALTSGGGDRLQLQLQAGSATLQLLAPVQVVIKPPPEEVDQLLWNGQALMAEANRPGTYRVDATRAAAPAPLRPQTAPRSP